MNILILYDSTDTTSEALTSEIQAILGDNPILFDAGTTKMDPCLGCFGCWLKTPGLCVHRDDGDTFIKNLLGSDYILIVNRITFGGYSSSIKTCLDRSIPTLHPYFEIRNGEMHHRQRYKKYPEYLFLGFGGISKAEEELFIEYTRANQVNMKKKNSNAVFIHSGGDDYKKWLSQEVLK